MDLAIHTQGPRREFGTFVAVNGIDLEVPRGPLYGFVGRNGAGKTATIKCPTGLLKPSGGTMRIPGLDPLSSPVAVKRQVGVAGLLALMSLSAFPTDQFAVDRAGLTLTFLGPKSGTEIVTGKAIGGLAARVLDAPRESLAMVAQGR